MCIPSTVIARPSLTAFLQMGVRYGSGLPPSAASTLMYVHRMLPSTFNATYSSGHLTRGIEELGHDFVLHLRQAPGLDAADSSLESF